MSRVALVGKPECHLCDQARLVVSSVCTQLGVAWEERNILAEPRLADEYWELIPVVLVDGDPIAHWHVTAEQLRAALEPVR